MVILRDPPSWNHSASRYATLFDSARKVTALDAAKWLCKQMDIEPKSLGFGDNTKTVETNFVETIPVAQSDQATTDVSSQSIIGEDSAAIEFAKTYIGKLRYCHTRKSWFTWAESHWERNETDLAFHWARLLARKIARGLDDKTRRSFEGMAFAGHIENFAKADPVFAVKHDAWDPDPMLLGTPGGTVNLRTGLVRPASPSDGITRTTAVAPADHADCPLWRGFLQDATGGSEDLTRFLRA